MKQLRSFLYPLLMLLAVVSCSDNEDITPSYADTDRLESLIDRDIPQIAQFCDNYGTYLLYKFDKNLDFTYQFEQATNWANANITTIGHDDAEVAVAMLYNNVFNCYNDSYKKNYYPRKMLLVGSIASSGELGLSVPVYGEHTAVANINSVSVAKMTKQDVMDVAADADLMTERCNQIHRALIADYLVKARGEYPVGNEYFTYSQNNYSSLMNSNRKTAAQLLADDPEFFYNRGFFNPDDMESTYFPSAEDDVLAYIQNMITMDKEEADMLMELPVMADKMHVLTIGLQSIGVDVVKINPWAEQFLKMEYIQPAVMFVDNVVTDNPKATLDVTITRGSHALSHLVVNVNGTDLPTIDLTTYDRMRIVVPVVIDGLHKGANPVTLTLYEEGRDKAAAVVNTAINYASMDNIAGITIKNSKDTDGQYRTTKVSYGDDSVMHPDGTGIETKENLVTICFDKVGWFDRYWEEHDSEYRAWKIYKNPETGMAEKIMEYERGYNETMTALVWTLKKSYDFIYSNERELTEVKLTNGNEAERTIVKDVVYVNGRIARYTYDNKTYVPVYATANGITTRVDILDSNMSGRCFAFDGTETLNSYYLSCLPAVIPGDVAEFPLQLFYSRYIFNGIPGVWSTGWKSQSSGGAMAKTADITIGDVKWTYTMKLQ